MPKKISPCSCEESLCYRAALEAIASPETANPRVLELVTIAREALAAVEPEEE